MIKFIYNLLQKLWIRVIITILLIIIVLLKYDSGSSDFSVGEFKLPLTIEKLCKAIVDDNYNVSIQAPINTINWLNELLKVPNFYDILHVKKPNINFSKSITDLVDKNKDNRNKNFSDLNNDEQNTIKRLNRLLLEETYPQETPKSYDSKNIYDVAKAWLCVGNLVSLCISGFIICYTITEVFKETAQSMAKVIEYILLVGLILIGIFVYWIMSLLPENKLRLFELSPIAIVIGILFFDRWLIRQNQIYFPRLYKSHDFVMNFDIGILCGLVVTYFVSLTMEKTVGNAFAQGFRSGASAFQLIIANLIFDPCIYEFKLQDVRVNKK